MINGIAEIKDIKDISACLTRENKKYVIAVANALLFSQGMIETSACQASDRVVKMQNSLKS